MNLEAFKLSALLVAIYVKEQILSIWHFIDCYIYPDLKNSYIPYKWGYDDRKHTCLYGSTVELKSNTCQKPRCEITECPFNVRYKTSDKL